VVYFFGFLARIAELQAIEIASELYRDRPPRMLLAPLLKRDRRAIYAKSAWLKAPMHLLSTGFSVRFGAVTGVAKTLKLTVFEAQPLLITRFSRPDRLDVVRARGGDIPPPANTFST
jgi:hypothetical protein